MRNILKSTAVNLPILLVSLVLVGLGLGLAANNMTEPDTQKNQTAVDASTAPPIRSHPESSQTYYSPTQNSPIGPLKAPSGPEQSTSSSTLANSATAPTKQTPSPEPPAPVKGTAPQPPSTEPTPSPISGCVVCGAPVSPYGHGSERIMCPMYCVRMD